MIKAMIVITKISEYLYRVFNKSWQLGRGDRGGTHKPGRGDRGVLTSLGGGVGGFSPEYWVELCHWTFTNLTLF